MTWEECDASSFQNPTPAKWVVFDLLTTQTSAGKRRSAVAWAHGVVMSPQEVWKLVEEIVRAVESV